MEKNLELLFECMKGYIYIYIYICIYIFHFTLKLKIQKQSSINLNFLGLVYGYMIPPKGNTHYTCRTLGDNPVSLSNAG